MKKLKLLFVLSEPLNPENNLSLRTNKTQTGFVPAQLSSIVLALNFI